MEIANTTTEFAIFTTRGGMMGFVNSRCDDFEALANEFVDRLPMQAKFEVAYYGQADWATETGFVADREFTEYANDEYGIRVWFSRGSDQNGGTLIMMQDAEDRPEIAVVVWNAE